MVRSNVGESVSISSNIVYVARVTLATASRRIAEGPFDVLTRSTEWMERID